MGNAHYDRIRRLAKDIRAEYPGMHLRLEFRWNKVWFQLLRHPATEFAKVPLHGRVAMLAPGTVLLTGKVAPLDFPIDEINGTLVVLLK